MQKSKAVSSGDSPDRGGSPGEDAKQKASELSPDAS